MSEKRPSILLFFTDDQRFDTLSALGNPDIHTPNLDALVARGMTFTHAHIPGGTSGAVCMPSRAMLHTGRTLFHLNGSGEEVPSEHTLLGEHLRANGYDTFGTGKWHNGRSAYARSFSCGDEIFFGGMDDHWNVQAYHFDPTGQYDTTLPVTPEAFRSNRVVMRPCDHIHAGRHSTDLFKDTAVEFLDNRKGNDTPFFAYVSLLAPHDPRTMPEEFLKLYDPATIELPGNFASEHLIDTGALDVRDELLAAKPRDPEEIKRHIIEYYAMISHLDHAFGEVVDGLKRNGLFENTIIVFAGDNGLALGQHGLMGKQNLYEHSVRVPLIFAGPGIPHGERRSALAYLLDIFPTICDQTGVETPDSVEGRSLTSCIAATDNAVRDELYLAYVTTIRGVSDGTHKLIEYACGATQLFDLKNDPLETRNLAESETAQPLVEQYREKLVRLARDWDDFSHPMGQEFWSQRTDLHRQA